jgi:hypothetical protein
VTTRGILNIYLHCGSYVTVENPVFRDVTPCSLLVSITPYGVKFEKKVKNAVLWDVTPCGFVRIDVSEEHIASLIRVTTIGELGIKLAITRN